MKQAIREYKKATGNIPGTVELLMSYVENGVAFTGEYGDIDERFYDEIQMSGCRIPNYYCWIPLPLSCITCQ